MEVEAAVARETEAGAIRAMTEVGAEGPEAEEVAKELAAAARGGHRADMQLSGVGPTPTHALGTFLGGSAGKSKGAAAMAGQHRSR